MITKTNFSEKPEKIHYENVLGKVKAWLRKNIKKKEETIETFDETYKIVSYEADEVYFEAENISLDEIEKNFDKYYENGKTWQPKSISNSVMTNKELTNTCEDLKNQQLDLCDAIASLYENVATLSL